MRQTATMLCAAAVLLAAVPRANAAGSDTVQLQVLAIQATTKNKDISPQLKQIAAQLKKQFKYTGFKLVGRSTGAAKLSATHTAKLPGGYEMKLTPLKREATRIQIKIEVTQVQHGKRSIKLRTTVWLTPGKTMLVGGWQLSGGDVLIAGFSAK